MMHHIVAAQFCRQAATDAKTAAKVFLRALRARIRRLGVCLGALAAWRQMTARCDE
jgi:hypothetical protein